MPKGPAAAARVSRFSLFLLVANACSFRTGELVRQAQSNGIML
jgi:hypothetical protein